MNKDILKQMGFEKEVEFIEGGKCPICKKIIKVEDFSDELSVGEYALSGLCQQCQDAFYEEPAE